MAPPTSPGLSARWADILSSVQQALARAEADAARSAQGLESPSSLPSPAAWDRQLAELADHARRWHALTAGADLVAGEAEAALQASETALREWAAHAGELGRKLATGADVSV